LLDANLALVDRLLVEERQGFAYLEANAFSDAVIDEIDRRQGVDYAGNGDLERAEIVQNLSAPRGISSQRSKPRRSSRQVAEALTESADAQVVLDAIRAAEKADDRA
jgi:hypothetical protein